jgi:hypothetical protein
VVRVRRKRPRFTTKPVAELAESDAAVPLHVEALQPVAGGEGERGVDVGMTLAVGGSVCPTPAVRGLSAVRTRALSDEALAREKGKRARVGGSPASM